MHLENEFQCLELWLSQTGIHGASAFLLEVEGNQTLASALSWAGFETLTQDYLLNEKFNTNNIRRAWGIFS